MAEKKIITDEKLLERKSTDIDIKSEDLKQIIEDLEDTAEANRKECAGLAANQIGYLSRVCIVKVDHWYTVFINPKSVKMGGRMLKGKESCLSRPNKPSIIKMRAQRVTIEHTLVDGRTIKETFYGFTARVFQHEIDHFNGKLI